MRHYDGIVFDLDGTLWDASRASATGWNVALQSDDVGRRTVSQDDIRSVSGKPFEDCVATLFPNLSPADHSRLTRVLDAHEKAHVEADGGDAYPGVINGVENLAREYRLFLVSNCQDWYLEAFWKHFALRPFFEAWDCYGVSGSSKTEMLKGIVRRHHLSQSIYIGDTVADKQASAAAGIDFGYVAYGFGTVAEAPISFASFDDLVTWFYT